METKDLRYTPAEYMREHQRTYTVLDINEGDSTVVVVSPAMQYSDALRAYDITTVDSILVTDTVSKWILTGESIWDTLEHLRLQIHTVDSQRIALPDGFVGRVLIARVTPDANAEAPELIRLGALLHRIQQEPTAAVVYQHKVKPVEPDLDPENGYPYDPNSGFFNIDLFSPAIYLQLPDDTEYVPKRTPILNETQSEDYSLDELHTFWRDYERADERQQRVMPVLYKSPNWNPDADWQVKHTPHIIQINKPIEGIALNIRLTRGYCYPKNFWCRIEPDERLHEDTDCKLISIKDIKHVPNTESELRTYMGAAKCLKIPFMRIDGNQLYLYLYTRASGLQSYIGTKYGDPISLRNTHPLEHKAVVSYDSDSVKAHTNDYTDVYSPPVMEGYRTIAQKELLGSNYKEFLMDVSRTARTTTGATVTSGGGWDGRLGKPIPPTVTNETFTISATSPDAYRFVAPETFEALLDMPLGLHKVDAIPESYAVPNPKGHLERDGLPELMNFTMSRWVVVKTSDQRTFMFDLPEISPAPQDMVGLLGYTQWDFIGVGSAGTGLGYGLAGSPNSTWVMDEVYFKSRNLYHLKGLYEKWQQLRKASGHSTSDSLSSS